MKGVGKPVFVAFRAHVARRWAARLMKLRRLPHGLGRGKGAQCVLMVTTRASGTTSRRYLSRSDVARLFEVSPGTVARWTREGKLSFVLTLGGQRRYLREQIIALMRRDAGTLGEAPARSAATCELPGPERRNP